LSIGKKTKNIQHFPIVASRNNECSQAFNSIVNKSLGPGKIA